MTISKQRCGLFVSKEDKPIPLTAIHYEATVRAFASQVTIRQTFENEEKVDLECVYGFPINNQASITDLSVKIGDRVISSRFKKKDAALKEYNDALAKGDGAYLLDQSDRSDDTFVLSVGRLPPQSECTVSITYVCTLESVSEKILRLVIPTALSPRYNPHLETSVQSTVHPPEKYQTSVTYSATLDANITAFDSVKAVTSPSHPISVRMKEANKVQVSFGANHQPVDRDIVIEIEVNSNPQHHVEVEQISENHFAAMYSFIPAFPKDGVRNIKTELVFLVDCSGSMQAEGKIGEAKRAMQIFLQSIPEGCYFNFYRFGSSFESLFPLSELYGSESFLKAKAYAKSTEANMGGTEILKPLENIFAQTPRPEFSRQLFVLTDGDVSNTEEVLNLVRRNESCTRVFAFGVGDSPSRSLVNGMAAAGNGKSEFIKKGEILEGKVGRHLDRALQPSVVNASILWEGVKNAQQVPSKFPPVFRGDRQLAYVFFEESGNLDGSENPSVVLQINGTLKETNFEMPSVGKPEGSMVSKLAARALIKELEISGDNDALPPPQSIGSQQARATNLQVKEEKTRGSTQDKITAISLTYGLLSRHVSLVAVETRNTKESGAEPSKIELREIPISVGGSIYGSPGAITGRSHKKMALCAMAPRMAPRAPMMMMRSSAGAIRETSSANLMADFMSSEKSSAAEISDEMRGTPLIQLLDLQLWNGSWEFSEALEKLIGVSQKMLTDVITLRMDFHALATLSVMTYLEKYFLDEINVWQAIIRKARIFVAKTADDAVIEETINVLKPLFHKV